MVLLFWAAVIAVLSGLAMKLAFNTGFFDSPTVERYRRITWLEYGLGTLLLLVVICPATVVIGTNVARSNLLRYDEFWGGYEVKAIKSTTTCTRDGPCVHEYNCDPYNHVHETRHHDKDGNYTHSTYSDHTHYHSCPYATQEDTYTVQTTLDDHMIANHIFAENPREWRGGSGVPKNVPRGAPKFWLEAKERIESGDPGPATVFPRKYDNYILASQNTILKKFSGAVEKYQKQLPAPASTKGIHTHYYADKAYFVGVSVPNKKEWQDSVMRFNAALGADLQGDLHVLFVDHDAVDPDEYAGALNAWWTGKEFGKKALSKNGLAVIVGVDGDQVAWAEAFTGMPLGNEALLLDISRELPGTPLDPDELLGRPVGNVRSVKGDTKVTIDHGDGALEEIVWGTHQFERVCMVCDDEGETGGGFGYLGGEIQPTTGQKVVILVVVAFFALVVWGIAGAVGKHNNTEGAAWWNR